MPECREEVRREQHVPHVQFLAQGALGDFPLAHPGLGHERVGVFVLQVDDGLDAVPLDGVAHPARGHLPGSVEPPRCDLAEPLGRG